MKNILIVLCCGLLASCVRINIVPAGGSSAIRVLTYNIHAGKDTERRVNLERVAALIDSAQADVVLLQEVDRKTQRAQGVDHFDELRRLTGMHGLFGKSIDFQGGQYGIAILSRWPLDSVRALPLGAEPATDEYEPRIALHARTQTPYGTLHVVATHLDAGGSSSYRKQELIAILAHLQESVPPDAPLVLGGDLNARPQTTEIRALSFVLEDAFTKCGSGQGETFPAHSPDRRIDYIFVRGLTCRSARVWHSLASDHRPVLTILQFTGDR